MGLRDWVSEKETEGIVIYGARHGFNGAPRLGLGEGIPGEVLDAGTFQLQWGSETGSRRRSA